MFGGLGPMALFWGFFWGGLGGLGGGGGGGAF